MPIPTFDKMFRPMLSLASQAPLSRKMAREAMTKHFGLSDDEKNALLPSGHATYVANRTGWASRRLDRLHVLLRLAADADRDLGEQGLELTNCARRRQIA